MTKILKLTAGLAAALALSEPPTVRSRKVEYHNLLTRTAAKKRRRNRMRNKMARISRRINRRRAKR